MVALNPAYAPCESTRAVKNRIGDFFCESVDRVGSNRLAAQQPRLENELSFTITASGRPLFQNSDPIGFDGGLNWYAYANGNPVLFLDLEGNFGFFGAGIGAIVGGTLGLLGGFGGSLLGDAAQAATSNLRAGSKLARDLVSGGMLDDTFKPLFKSDCPAL
jgi:hypothetical protein